MLRHVQRVSGMTALISIVVLGVVALLVSQWPLLRKTLWGAVAVVAVLAAWNEITD